MISLGTTVVALAVCGAPHETVLLDFYADWCGPCKAMDGIVHDLRSEGYPVRKVNYDREPQVAAKYGVTELPTFVMLANGKEVDRQVGYTDRMRLEQMFQKAKARSRTLPAQPAEPETELDLEDRSGPAEWKLPPSWDAREQELVSEEQLIAVTVRIRIEDSDGHSSGSGTIIDARRGEALILSCGHILRDSRGKGQITVDLFGPVPAIGIPGRLVSYNEDRDLGLLAIRTPGPVVSAKVAPKDFQMRKGDRVYTVGCSHGDQPTIQRSRVTCINRYMGPPNLEVAGLPVQGRSGGGLFSAEGLVVGVCNAADPKEREGLYSALEAIHAELDESELDFVYHSDRAIPSGRGLGSTVAQNPPPMPEAMPETLLLDQRIGLPAPAAPVRALPPRQEIAAQLSPEQRATLAEIIRRAREGAEVICVVRSRRDPTAPSEIFTLDGASPAFLEQLAEAARSPLDPVQPLRQGIYETQCSVRKAP